MFFHLLYIILSMQACKSVLAKEDSTASAAGTGLARVVSTSAAPPSDSLSVGAGVGASRRTADTVVDVEDSFEEDLPEENPYAILFKGFEMAMKKIPLVSDSPLETELKDALRILGITGNHEKSESLWQSKENFTNLLGIRTKLPGSYSSSKIALRNTARADYLKSVGWRLSKLQSKFLMLLELDRAQDNFEKKKAYVLLQKISHDQSPAFNTFARQYKEIIKEDIFRGIRIVMAENKVTRTTKEKVSSVTTSVLKIVAGVSSMVVGAVQLATPSMLSYCMGSRIEIYPANTTLPLVSSGARNISCFPETYRNGTYVEPYCEGRVLNVCSLSSFTGITGSAYLITGGISLLSGVIDLVIHPQGFTDISTVGSEIEINEKALVDEMLSIVMREKDLDLQEKLITAGLSSLKGLLPRAKGVNIVGSVKAVMEAALKEGEIT